MGEMNEQTMRSYFNIVYILSLIYGIVITITIFGAIIGIPMIIASTKFKEAKDAPMQRIFEMQKSLYAWGIFLGIVSLPTGIIIFIYSSNINDYLSYLMNGGNPNQNYNANWTNFNQNNNGNVYDSNQNFNQNNMNQNHGGQSFDDKVQKLKEAQKMFQNGTITQEEYDKIRKQILGI